MMVSEIYFTSKGPITLTDLDVLDHTKKKRVMTARKLATITGVAPIHCRKFLDAMTDAGLLTRDKPGSVYQYEVA